jgi:serine/threonine protein kinase
MSKGPSNPYLLPVLKKKREEERWTFEKRYKSQSHIGSGSYGNIWEVSLQPDFSRWLQIRYRTDPQCLKGPFAVKIQDYDAYFWSSFSFLREMDALMQTRSCYGTVNIHDCVFDEVHQRVYIVMDKYEQTLFQYIQNSTFEERMKTLPYITTQLLLGLCDLDRKGLGHRDIKPSNILLQTFRYDTEDLKDEQDDREEDEDLYYLFGQRVLQSSRTDIRRSDPWTFSKKEPVEDDKNEMVVIALCDFGLSKRLVPGRDTPCLVTLNYRPPELFFESQFVYSSNADVWSAGCVLFQYVTQRMLFEGVTECTVMRNILKHSPLGDIPKEWRQRQDCPFPPVANTTDCYSPNLRTRLFSMIKKSTYSIPEDFVDLLEKMLQHDPNSARPSAEQLLSHPYVSAYVPIVKKKLAAIWSRKKCKDRVLPVGEHEETFSWAFSDTVNVNTEALSDTLGLHSSRITLEHRSLFTNWLWCQNSMRGFHASTAIAALCTFDRFMSYSKETIPAHNDQETYLLAGLICLYLVLMYYEPQVTTLTSLIDKSGYTFENTTVKKMLHTVLYALHFQLSTPTHWTLYLRYRNMIWDTWKQQFHKDTVFTMTDHDDDHVDFGAECPTPAQDDAVARLVFLCLKRMSLAKLPKAELLRMCVTRIQLHYELIESPPLLRHVVQPLF